LGLTTHGNITFKLAINSKLYTLTLDEKTPHHRWTNIIATFDKPGGMVTLYVNGLKRGYIDVPKAGITMNRSDLMIGANNIKTKATDLVRSDNNIPQIFGIEGLIDEVKIYDTALTASEVTEAYTNSVPGEKIINNPDLQPRVLPGQEPESSTFGAYYTRLEYHDLWDNLWRVDEYADIIVKFDEMPTGIVFWRDTSYAPSWVTENNLWMGDQSAEVGGPYGCAEHMADKQQRHTHARIIENTPARIVIHWRYSCADIAYIFDSPDNWSDEYLTIYPDGTSVRKVCFHGEDIPEWHEPQLYCQAGSGPVDVISTKAVSVANLYGKVAHLDFSDGPGVNPLEDSCIELYNLKSKYRIFSIFPHGTKFITNGWFNTEQSPYTPDPFAGPWNHFPVSQLLSDGRLATAYDRMISSALGGCKGVILGNIGLYGFTDKSICYLISLARSWNYPAKVNDVRGAVKPVYNKEERAFELIAKARDISFTLNGSDSSPIVNPVFVVHDWGDTDAKVRINGQVHTESLKQGHVITANKDKLVIYIKIMVTSPLHIQISTATCRVD